jgi:nitrogen fixation-related uncharacterized protein
MSPYYLFWASLIVLSLWASLGGFIWAYRHGQFKDQDRARYLPLRGEQTRLSPDRGAGAISEMYVLLGILAIGASGLLAVALTLILTAAGVWQ